MFGKSFSIEGSVTPDKSEAVARAIAGHVLQTEITRRHLDFDRLTGKYYIYAGDYDSTHPTESTPIFSIEVKPNPYVENTILISLRQIHSFDAVDRLSSDFRHFVAEVLKNTLVPSPQPVPSQPAAQPAAFVYGQNFFFSTLSHPGILAPKQMDMFISAFENLVLDKVSKPINRRVEDFSSSIRYTLRDSAGNTVTAVNFCFNSSDLAIHVGGAIGSGITDKTATDINKICEKLLDGILGTLPQAVQPAPARDLEALGHSACEAREPPSCIIRARPKGESPGATPSTTSDKTLEHWACAFFSGSTHHEMLGSRAPRSGSASVHIPQSMPNTPPKLVFRFDTMPAISADNSIALLKTLQNLFEGQLSRIRAGACSINSCAYILFDAAGTFPVELATIVNDRMAGTVVVNVTPEFHSRIKPGADSSEQTLRVLVNEELGPIKQVEAARAEKEAAVIARINASQAPKGTSKQTGFVRFDHSNDPLPRPGPGNRGRLRCY